MNFNPFGNSFYICILKEMIRLLLGALRQEEYERVICFRTQTESYGKKIFMGKVNLQPIQCRPVENINIYFIKMFSSVVFLDRDFAFYNTF